MNPNDQEFFNGLSQHATRWGESLLSRSSRERVRAEMQKPLPLGHQRVRAPPHRQGASALSTDRRFDEPRVKRIACVWRIAGIIVRNRRVSRNERARSTQFRL